MKKILLFLVLLAVLATACGGNPPGKTEGWWRQAVFYEIFVRSFYDTDGDGIGDINGITSKLDYLQDLGISGIWLMPIHPSPTYHGYDVLDYYAVNPDYGTLDDLKNLVEQAHERGIKVIMDLVINHTSDQHPFFVDARQDPASPYRDWYVWSDSSAGNHWYSGEGGYYYAFFDSSMPDLNYRNPEVTAEMVKVAQFWLVEGGMDGFRIDAAKHLIEEDQLLEGTQATHDWLKGFNAAIKSINPQAYLVGEIYGAGAFAATAYTGDQLDQIFNFEMAGGMTGSALGGSNTGMRSAITFALEHMPEGEYATFLANHDQNRIMSQLNGNAEKAGLAAFLLLTLPGTPYLYYGEEIGMQGRKPDEDIRRPMQWSGDENAGFSTVTPWREVEKDTQQVNVDLQTADPGSLLSEYKTLIRLRHDHPALQTGSITWIDTGTPAVYAALRTTLEETLLVLANLSNRQVDSVQLEIPRGMLKEGNYQLDALLGSGAAANTTLKQGVFEADLVTPLPAYGRWVISLVR